MASLFERTRPKTWDAVVGQDAAVKLLQRLKPGGRAYWVSGASGSGKTTLARILAHEHCESWHVDEIDAQDCTLDYLRAIEVDMSYRGMGVLHGKCWIVNEAHGLRGAILARFLTLIERLPDHCFIIFTTTKKGEQTLFADFDDTAPFLSRCTVVPMASAKIPEWGKDADKCPVLLAFAKRAMAIAQAENLDGRPLEEYLKLAYKCKGNLREMLSRIDAGEMLV